VACCGSAGGGGDDAGDDDPGVDASTSSALDPAKCGPFAQSFVNAVMRCGGSVPANAQQAFDGFCKKGVTKAAMCGGNPAGGLACFEKEDTTDWVCTLGGGDVLPACNGDLKSALGALCLIALGNPQCSSGIACQYDVDCSQGFACNSATNECFAKNAYCVGLPCTYDVDCPSSEKCNSAEGACIKR
jgi:hypothetical protein